VLARCLLASSLVAQVLYWPYHEVLTVAQQAESNTARAEAEVSRPDEGFCHAAPTSLPPPPSPPTLPIYYFLCRDFAQICRWSSEEGRDASSTLGSDEAGDDDMDKSTEPPPRAIYVLITALLEHRSTKPHLGCGFKKSGFHEFPLPQRHLDERNHVTIQIKS
jgi:hypothetical protein